jgi:hypothetical protein
MLLLDGVLPNVTGNGLSNVNYSLTPTFAVNRLDSQSVCGPLNPDNDDEDE